MPTNIEHKESQLRETLGDDKFEELVKNQIELFKGLINRKGAIGILYSKSLGKEETINPHEEFLEKWKGRLKYIVNNSVVRDQILANVVNPDGTYNHFKFGLSKMAKTENENMRYSEAPFECYIFILSVYSNYHEQYGSFTSVKFLLWENVATPPKVYTSILPKFMSICTSKNSYNRLYFVKFDGLKKSETHKERQYYSGNVKPIAKINRDVQASLS